MKKFLKFVFVGLIFGVAAEVVNQIYVHKNVHGLFQTTLVYLFFLIILFPLKEVFNKIVKNKFSNALIWYIMLGIFGLFIEWKLLGNAGAAIHGQIAMFTFWGSFGLMPMIFTAQPQFPEITKPIIKFSAMWIPIYLIVGIPNPGLGLIIWIFGTIWLNFYYFQYFRLMKKQD